MLLFVLYFVFIGLLAALAIWMYRHLPSQRDFQEDLVGRAATQSTMTLRTQQGFISLETRIRKGRRPDRHWREHGDELKAPWGW